MRCLVPVMVLLALSGHLHAETINVPGDHATIQGAIDAAADGDEILVAAGTYPETLFPGTKSFILRGSVDASGAPTTFVISDADSAIRLNDNDSADLLFENLRLRGPSNWSLSRGGGFYCSDSRPTLRNCVFDTCTAINGSYNYGGGAFALCQFSDLTPTFIDCTFLNCRAHYGGGFYFYVHTSSKFAASVSLRGCSFINNDAEDEGGAIYLYGEAGIHIEDCRFESNSTGGLASGIKHAYACRTTVKDSIFCSDDPTSMHIRTSYTELGGNCFTDDCADDDGDGVPDSCVFTQSCREDANGDGYVDGADLGLLIASWGSATPCSVDINGDGQVNGADLGLLVARWGACN
ncbi:MAG: right-handed parallel beta-helix repeat-containing protein [Phycisphaerales bacterium]|nr:right-handed parallel beta-helix repeat-containing protein [Phycisphaerales bacterium]